MESEKGREKEEKKGENQGVVSWAFLQLKAFVPSVKVKLHGWFLQLQSSKKPLMVQLLTLFLNFLFMRWVGSPLSYSTLCFGDKWGQMLVYFPLVSIVTEVSDNLYSHFCYNEINFLHGVLPPLEAFFHVISGVT